MLITKQLLTKCAQYLTEFGFEKTSFAKGVYVFLSKDTFEITHLQIIDDEVMYNKKHTISCISDLVNIVSDKYNLEYEKFPVLNSFLIKISGNATCLNEPSTWSRFLDEINNALIESKLNGIEETKVKHKIKKTIC